MKSYKKIVATVFALVVALALVACGGSAGGSTSASGSAASAKPLGSRLRGNDDPEHDVVRSMFTPPPCVACRGIRVRRKKPRAQRIRYTGRAGLPIRCGG